MATLPERPISPERGPIMNRFSGTLLAIVVTLTCSSCRVPSIEAAAENLGALELGSIQFDATGAAFSVGQPYLAGEAWPRVDVVGYTAAIDYETGSMRVELVRQQPTPEPRGGGIRFPGQQRQVQLVSGTHAWNVPAAAPDGSQPNAQPQPGAAAERRLQIWTTPQGFLKAALTNAATLEEMDGGSEAWFTVDGRYRVVGTINASNDVERVQTWIDNPVLGDMLVETTYSDYRDFGGVRFPARIRQSQGGHPSLELTVTAVRANPAVDVAVPQNVIDFQPAPVQASVEQVAPGVYYVRGGSHHSAAIEMSDHVVVVEAPQSEERGLAVIAALREALPDKPIRYVVNTHVHFDHSGGLRAFVAEGATVVTHQSNRAFYETAWLAPRTLNPDRMSQTGAQPTFHAVGPQDELRDGTRTVQIYSIEGQEHNAGFLMVYLPEERILVEVDLFAPAPPNAPPPSSPNPAALALYDNIQRLGLDVQQILALHGPRVATMEDLRAAAGR